jgi:hypothetical protein
LERDDRVPGTPPEDAVDRSRRQVAEEDEPLLQVSYLRAAIPEV